MKWQIIYLYNLKEVNVYKNKNKILIKSENKKFFLEKVINPVIIYEINKILNNKTEKYKIVENVNKEIVSKIENNFYTLIEINNNYLIQSYNIYLNPIDYKNNILNHSNWSQLWLVKNDFYNEHKHTLKGRFTILYESIDYFIGMAENALLCLNYNKIKHKHLTICNLDQEDKQNPLKIIIDSREREIAEELKYKFFEQNINIDLKTIESKIIKENLDYNLFFIRMLYPTYYFNKYDSIINKKIEEKEIKKILNKINEYEQILKNIQKKTSILYRIDWL